MPLLEDLRVFQDALPDGSRGYNGDFRSGCPRGSNLRVRVKFAPSHTPPDEERSNKEAPGWICIFDLNLGRRRWVERGLNLIQSRVK